MLGETSKCFVGRHLN